MNDIRLIHGDCLEILPTLEAGSVDAVIADIPYGTTACKWDTVIPFEPMWESLERVTNPKAAIVLFGSQPFTSALVMSRTEWFKYEWVWDKGRGVGHLNARSRPMMQTESICIFYRQQATYNPQMRKRASPRLSKNYSTQTVYGQTQDTFVGDILPEKYPVNLIEFSKSAQQELVLHPTQKPVALLDYLVRTYTNEGDTVLDFTMGSGTTGVACVKTGRNFIGIEIEQTYHDIAVKRVAEAQMQPRLM